MVKPGQRNFPPISYLIERRPVWFLVGLVASQFFPGPRFSWLQSELFCSYTTTFITFYLMQDSITSCQLKNFLLSCFIYCYEPN